MDIKTLFQSGEKKLNLTHREQISKYFALLIMELSMNEINEELDKDIQKLRKIRDEFENWCLVENNG